MTQNQKIIMAIWQGWKEMNAVRAATGVPLMYDGFKAGVSEEYFSQCVNDLHEAYRILTGEEPMPWPPVFEPRPEQEPR